MDNFPYGLASFGIPLIGSGSLIPVQSGNYLWVSSVSGSNSNDGSYEKPYGTLAYALTKAAAKDVIVVKEGHAETVTGIGGLTASVAGLSVIGLGTFNQRPRFLMDGATTVTFLVSAADVTIRNLVFASGHAAVVTCFNVTGKGCWIGSCEFKQNTTSENFLTCIKATGAANTADGLKVTNCYTYQIDATTVAFIHLIDDCADVFVNHNVVLTEGTGLATLITCATGKDLQGCFIAWNFLSSKATAGNLFISNDTASANNWGVIAHNRVRHADVTTSHTMGAVGGCGFFDNLSVSTDALSGFVLPAIDVDS